LPKKIKNTDSLGLLIVRGVFEMFMTDHQRRCLKPNALVFKFYQHLSL